MEKATSSLTAAEIRERHRRKKLRKRKILIARFSIFALIIIFGIGLSHATKHSIRGSLNKDVIFVTKMADTVPEKVENNLNTSTENDLVILAKDYVPDPLVCYLTFDDGPNETVTPKIADILRRYNAKATFFQVGSLIEANPEITKRLYNEGHLIGNHSYEHTYADLYASTDAFMSQINQTQDIIKQTTGQEFKIVRFPGGSHNAGRYAEIKQDCRAVLQSAGYFVCDWNSLNGDAEGGNRSAAQLVERAKETIGTHPQPIILMHDSKSKTAESLPEIIEYLIETGYTFDTLDNLRTE